MHLEKEVLILLTPPQVKPANNFGLLQAEIDLINELATTKNVALYLFGNPYALHLFDLSAMKIVVVAYQDFTTFQDVATAHFLGKLTAEGKLPVSINQQTP